MNHPFNALNWLVEKLAEHNRYVRQGEWVITGGLTKAVDIQRENTYLVELFDKDQLIGKLSF